MAVSECPECTCHIPMPPSASEGGRIDCPDCGARLRIASISPPLFETIGENE